MENQENNDVLRTLLDMRNGLVAADVNQKWNEVVTAVLETGGKGELTIKLMIRPSRLGMGGTVLEVQTEHDVKMKKPELEIGSQTFFIDKQGRLTRDDPAQTDMFEQAEQTQIERK